MHYILLIVLIIGSLTSAIAKRGYPNETKKEHTKSASKASSASSSLLKKDSSLTIFVVGQGIAPSFASSTAQAYALAKRAAISDAYRLIAERVNGVEIEGKDTIRNMAVQNSTLNIQVNAIIQNATLVETTFKNGLCEVEMKIRLEYSQFH